jgi:hypothetical protein
LSNFGYDTQLADERDYIRFRYQKPTAEQLTVVRKIVEALRDNTSNDPSARWQRQAAVDTLHARDRGLRAAESGLCFGRTDGTPTHIGRLDLFGEADDYRSLDAPRPPARSTAHPALSSHSHHRSPTLCAKVMVQRGSAWGCWTRRRCTCIRCVAS